MECIFCKIVAGEIPSERIWEDEDFFAFLDIAPIHAGHVLLIPKEHIDYIFDYDDPGYSEIFKRAKMLSERIKEATGAEKIGLAIEGIAVRHLHLHLVPVNKGNDLDPCKAKKASPEELKDMAERLRE